MRNRVYLLYFLLFSAIVPFTTASRPWAYIPVLISYLLISFYISHEELNVHIPRYVLISLGTLSLVLIIHIIITPVRETLFNSPIVRSPLIIGILVVNVLLIPQLFSKQEFFTSLSVSSAVIVLLGLPTYFISFSILGIEFSLNPGIHDFLDVNLYSSIFIGSNSFSRFVLAGVLSSLVLSMESKSYTPYFVINAGGIFLASSRATIGVLIATLMLFIIYTYLGRNSFYIAGIIGGIASTSIVLILSGILPGPTILTNLSSSRRLLWSAGFSAWQQYPIIGTGPINTAEAIRPFLQGTRWLGTHVHNSYIRILITTGIVGFASYLYFHIRTITYQILISDEIYSIGILLIAVAYTANQVSNVFSLFGLSVTSVIASITFGYIILNVAQYKDNKSNL